MKIGQPFYRINKNNILATFEEHKFDVIFIHGTEYASDNTFLLEYSQGFFNIANSLTTDRAVNKNTSVIQYNMDEFLKLTDEYKNVIIFNSIGYVSDVEILRSEFNSLVETEIVKERIKIQQQTDKIDEIENSITEPDFILIGGKINPDPILVNDTVEFFTKKDSEGLLFDVTEFTTFYVNNVRIGEAGVKTYKFTEHGTYTISCNYYELTYEFQITVI